MKCVLISILAKLNDCELLKNMAANKEIHAKRYGIIVPHIPIFMGMESLI